MLKKKRNNYVLHKKLFGISEHIHTKNAVYVFNNTKYKFPSRTRK
jgi:hypothetical protein